MGGRPLTMFCPTPNTDQQHRSASSLRYALVTHRPHCNLPYHTILATAPPGPLPNTEKSSAYAWYLLTKCRDIANVTMSTALSEWEDSEYSTLNIQYPSHLNTPV
jgi:hypothetical protein